MNGTFLLVIVLFDRQQVSAEAVDSQIRSKRKQEIAFFQARMDEVSIKIVRISVLLLSQHPLQVLGIEKQLAKKQGELQKIEVLCGSNQMATG